MNTNTLSSINIFNEFQKKKSPKKKLHNTQMTFVEKLMLFSTDIFYSTMVTQVKKIIAK